MGVRSKREKGFWDVRPEGYLENHALVLLAAAPAAGKQSSAGSVLEHLADTLVRLGRALEVLVGANLLADLLTL